MTRILMLSAALSAGLAIQATAGSFNVTFPHLTYPTEPSTPDVSTKTVTDTPKK